MLPRRVSVYYIIMRHIFDAYICGMLCMEQGRYKYNKFVYNLFTICIQLVFVFKM